MPWPYWAYWTQLCQIGVALRVAHPLPSTKTLKEQNLKEKHHKYMHTKDMQASIASFNWSP
jgi:hypothetical protein